MGLQAFLQVGIVNIINMDIIMDIIMDIYATISWTISIWSRPILHFVNISWVLMSSHIDCGEIQGQRL